MRNLVGYLYSKINTEDVYFDDTDYTVNLMTYESYFQELTGHNGENYSKEIVDDFVLLTYNDNNGTVYIGASTLSNSDVLLTLKEDIFDFKVYPGEGIDVYIKEKESGKVYLSNRIYYKVKDRFKSEIGVLDTQKLVDQNIYPRLVKVDYQNDEVLVIDDSKHIYLFDMNLDLKIDVSKRFSKDNIISKYTGNEDDYLIDYTCYNTDIISLTVHNKNVDSPLLEDIDNIIIYSISKDIILSVLPKNSFINKITNVDSRDYKNMMIWLTISQVDIDEESMKLLSKKGISNDIEFMEKFMEKHNSSFINGLIPVYNMKMEDNWFDDNFIVISNNTKDIGDIIDGINEFYLVGLAEEDSGYHFRYRFFYMKDGKIEYTDILSNTLPKKIYASPRSSVLTFEYHLPDFHNIVSYWHDLGDIIKFSKIVIKSNGLDGLRKVVEEIDYHLEVINDNEITYADEKSKLNNIIDNMEYFEDQNKYELSSTHLSDLTTGDIDVSCVNMSYGSDPRFMMYSNSNRENELRRRTCIDIPLSEYYEREAKVMKETKEYLDKEKKKLGLE